MHTDWDSAIYFQSLSYYGSMKHYIPLQPGASQTIVHFRVEQHERPVCLSVRLESVNLSITRRELVMFGQYNHEQTMPRKAMIFVPLWYAYV